ncbi:MULTISPECIES: hypothetical protein [Streptomyces]|uniref:Uncharacterized protein n=1 Tax=Streptomyces yangpuensis TaxID=1648182 RepID=A0ABY5PUH5_9ACTN|nr:MULTISPECIES: hypothetical protein [Streptomyces]UUY47560.1 hypothetical protein NRK68_10215 [Streptomyces yangpuensis]
MGRLWDKYTGTRYPDSGVAPRPTMELREALLALNGQDVPFRIRYAFPKEKADLVAEWRVLKPASGSGLSRKQVELRLKIRMRFVPLQREVRTLDEQVQVTWVGDPPKLAVSRESGSGPAPRVAREWTYEKGPDGRRRKVETFRFDSRDMKNPLRDMVLGAGWTWRGVVYRF